MPNSDHIPDPAPYASSGDFHRIFDEQIDGLYLLSFLLTGDREKAEQCFVSALQDAAQGNPVFKPWARAWARRAIILNATRVIRPRPIEGKTSSSFKRPKTLAEGRAELAAVLNLAPFERFVFVMVVLEHYSDHQCSMVLGCARRCVLETRIRALQQFGSAMEFQVGRRVDVVPEKLGLQDQRSAPELQLAPRSATQA
jgi:DNA-directed RNA polymerase specialized sigma24 family protein